MKIAPECSGMLRDIKQQLIMKQKWDLKLSRFNYKGDVSETKPNKQQTNNKQQQQTTNKVREFQKHKIHRNV